MNELETIELFIDESDDFYGIEAISLVHSPAIEENFVALNSQNKRVELKTVSEDKRILIGLALVPEKKIYRRHGNVEWNIMFSKDTVKKASELYLKRLKGNNATLEHEKITDGVSLIESWIVEDPKMDKTALYGLNAVEGAWAVVMKIDNEEVWNEVKEGKYLGFSIEGFFADKLEESQLSKKEKEDLDTLNKVIDLLKKVE
jgi:hypothetical protein